ncbi:MAG: DUF166 family protein [Anaerolineales bacterium]|jgi:hypothetical protein
MRIFAIISGQYGQRHVDNIREHGPKTWAVNTWQAPAVLPPIVDYPEDHLPETFPPADLILSFAEHKGVAELLPEIVKMTGAKAVIAAVDSEAWLPRGLARQLRGWLARMDVACATPKPLCSLTETHFGIARRKKEAHDSPLIAGFARYFGKPELELVIDENTRTVTAAQVKRDAVCGCARFVAEGLVGLSIDQVEEKAGLLHHHYPCMASMGVDVDFDDTLMHVSGNLMKETVGEQIKPYKRYFDPGGRSE